METVALVLFALAALIFLMQRTWQLPPRWLMAALLTHLIYVWWSLELDRPYEHHLSPADPVLQLSAVIGVIITWRWYAEVRRSFKK